MILCKKKYILNGWPFSTANVKGRTWGIQYFLRITSTPFAAKMYARATGTCLDHPASDLPACLPVCLHKEVRDAAFQYRRTLIAVTHSRAQSKSYPSNFVRFNHMNGNGVGKNEWVPYTYTRKYRALILFSWLKEKNNHLMWISRGDFDSVLCCWWWIQANMRWTIGMFDCKRSDLDALESSFGCIGCKQRSRLVDV